MKVTVKRIYDPAAKSDAPRVLVDRLWPRGVSKARAHIKAWLKGATPSNDLREWFHGDKEKRLKQFHKKYRAELQKNRAEIKKLFAPFGKSVTLVTGVKDIDESHIPVLAAFIKKF